MNVGTNHWIFAGLFALFFVAGIAYAYRGDIAKSPHLFKDSSTFVLSVILIIMILIVIKILYRFSQ